MRLSLLWTAILSAALPALAGAETLVVYSARNEQLIKPIFERYTAETGVEVRFTTGEAGMLIERLAAEGRNSPADVLMTVDAGELWHAADRGLLAPGHVGDADAQHPGQAARSRQSLVRPLGKSAHARLQPQEGRSQDH